MRKALILLSLVALAASIAPSAAVAAPGQEMYRVFVFTAGASTNTAQAAVRTIRDLGLANGFGVQANGDPASFTAENLARFRAVVFLDRARQPPQRGPGGGVRGLLRGRGRLRRHRLRDRDRA